MIRIFLSGLVTEKNYEEAKREFDAAEKMLTEQGYEVVNPMKIVPRTSTWREAMKICFKALETCQAIYMLKGYEFSKGASMEWFKARKLNLEIIYA